MWRNWIMAGALLAACGVSHAQASTDPLTDMAVTEFREAAAQAASNDGTLAQQAAYLMQVKNGLSLYRDGALTSQDAELLAHLVDQQQQAAKQARSSGGLSKQDLQLAELMQKSAALAKEILALDRTGKAYQQRMESFHNGIGYDAYRYAQDQGIEQL
ncbi:hypothetical protein [Pseudomonas sp. F(2018)]|uniref:hypothetical protein n=1 Tax=Pseudomonas sp. F(2018) TaxID=2502240 RepID=UPI0010F5A475|nr:hypothetical protein [Pseudomonas sp. F(2018)]